MIRKLQCISETFAPPMRKPRQPASSMRRQALVPGGFLNVEPPVRSLIGWVALAVVGDLLHLADDLGGIAGRALEQRLGEDPVGGHGSGGMGSPCRRARARERGRRDRRRAPRPGRPWSRARARRRSCAARRRSSRGCRDRTRARQCRPRPPRAPPSRRGRPRRHAGGGPARYGSRRNRGRGG